MGELVVEFAGDAVEVAERLTFGRAGDLELDSNPHLHRLVGEFARTDEGWWIRNLGSRLFLSVTADDGTRVDLAPASQHLITAGRGVVRVTAGQARYEMAFRTETPAMRRVDVDDSDDLATRPFEAILTPREVV